LVSWDIPSSHSVGDSGHTSDHNLITTALDQIITLLPSIYNILNYGADPTGVSDSTAAITNTIAAASDTAYGVVYIPAGVYLVSSSLNLPVNIALIGDGAVGGTVSGVRGGSILQLTSGFSGAYVLGISEVSNATVNGTTVKGLMIYGGSQTATAVDGIQITGPAMTILRDLKITQMSGWGINTGLDLSASEIGPYGQDWDSISIDSCGVVSGGGVNLIFAEDSTFRNIYSIGNNNGPGFQITGCDNSHFTDCRAEWNSTYGFYITNQTISSVDYTWTYTTGMCQFSNCSTDRNYYDGIRIDGTWTPSSGPGTGPAILLFTGQVNRRDGAANSEASGTYAGLSVDSSNLPVVFSGFSQMTGLNDGGTGNQSPRYGIYITGVSSGVPIMLGPGIAWGYTSAINDASSRSTQTGINSQTGINYSSTI
jgi:hypothetical protein